MTVEGMDQGRQLKVAINVQVTPGTTGGVAQFIASLIKALGQLIDGSETYTIIVQSQQELDWLKAYTGPNQRFVLKPRSSSKYGRTADKGLRTFSGLVKSAVRPAAEYVQRFLSVPDPRCWPEVPLSDGFYESLGCHVIHIPTQSFVLCALPTIYNPHDLQHLHWPQFFTPSTLARRETIYPAGCHFANTVAVGAHWIKDDIVRQYRIDADKIQVIPLASPTEAYQTPSQDYLSTVKSKYHLEQPFALYPAVTWPHKNHIRLLEALAHLRDTRNLAIPLVCTGSRYEDFWPSVERRVEELKLRSQVKFLGFVSEDDLRALYHLSQFLMLPTLYEADSFPIYEAWLDGLPVACSNVTALPEQVMDAALLFDPISVESISSALAKMATDNELRKELRKRGYQRVKDFDWERTAKAYRAVYRRAGNFPLTEEDRSLLAWDWMREPHRKLEQPLL
jgi:glycosyltransferase involved in cell wall biosynthesis